MSHSGLDAARNSNGGGGGGGGVAPPMRASLVALLSLAGWCKLPSWQQFPVSSQRVALGGVVTSPHRFFAGEGEKPEPLSPHAEKGEHREKHNTI